MFYKNKILFKKIGCVFFVFFNKTQHKLEQSLQGFFKSVLLQTAKGSQSGYFGQGFFNFSFQRFRKKLE